MKKAPVSIHDVAYKYIYAICVIYKFVIVKFDNSLYSILYERLQLCTLHTVGQIY